MMWSGILGHGIAAGGVNELDAAYKLCNAVPGS